MSVFLVHKFEKKYILNTHIIDREKLPKHVAIIMDGNGRWAKQKGKMRIFGHEHGVNAVRKVIEEVVKLRIPYLTLYTFSTENWQRPKIEVEALMKLLIGGLGSEIEKMHQNNIRFNAIGNLKSFPESVQKQLLSAIEKTKENTGSMVTLALGYGSRQEIIQATKSIAFDVKHNLINIEDIENIFDKYLYTQDMPDVDLLIRTSGEYRISNFLLWQLAYAELYFTDVYWPDFTQEHLHQAILSYQNRERRFGKTSEQLS